MAQLIINVGTSPNDGTGDPIRTAYQKTNTNFGELYARVQTSPPGSLIGTVGDQPGMYAYDSLYFYYCFANYDGSTVIWNQITGTGNIISNEISSGTSNVAIPSVNGNVRVAVGNVGNVAVFTTTGMVVAGNIAVGNILTDNYFYANGAPFAGGGGGGSYGNANVAAYLQNGVAGDIIPSANVTYSLGNASNQWAELWVGSNTIYIDSVPVTVVGNVLTVAGQQVLTSNSPGSLSVAGNITAGNILSNAVVSGTTAVFSGNVSAGNLNSTATVTAADGAFSGNVAASNFNTAGSVVAAAGSISGNLTAANLVSANNVTGVSGTFSGNVIASYFLGDGSQLSNLPSGSNYGNANVAAYLPNYTGNLNAGNLNVDNTFYIGGTAFTRTLTIGTRFSPVSVALASNNSFEVVGRTGNVTVYTT